VKTSSSTAPPYNRTVAATNTYNNNRNKNKSKNNNNNNSNQKKGSGGKKKHLPDAEWFDMSKAQQEEYSAKQKAEAISKAAAGGSTNRNLLMVQQDQPHKQPHNDRECWGNFAERPMADPSEYVAREVPSPSEVKQPAFPRRGILQLGVTHRPIFERAFSAFNKSSEKTSGTEDTDSTGSKKKRCSEKLPIWKRQRSSTDHTGSMSGEPEVVQPLPTLDAKTVAEAIEAATRTVAATTTTTAEPSSGTVTEDDIPSVSNEAATSPPTIIGAIPQKQRGYNINPAEAGNLFLTRIREREEAVLSLDKDAKIPAKEPVARKETDTGDALSDSPAIAARNIKQAEGQPNCYTSAADHSGIN
jgi:hypothetical protein